jgi:hypothetical protein
MMGALFPSAQAWAAPDYQPIVPTMEGTTIILSGHDLTIEQLIEVARYGAKVVYAPGVVQQASDARDLILEADAEGIPIYGVNRGRGALREEKGTQVSFPPMLDAGMLPEITDEELVRAVLVILANTVGGGAATPAQSQRLLDLLNHRITPVAYTHGMVGEVDLPALPSAIAATIQGEGDAYDQGLRMPAKRCGGVHYCPGEYGRRRRAAYRAVHGSQTHGILHRDQACGRTDAGADPRFARAVRTVLGIHGYVAGDTKPVVVRGARGQRGRYRCC